MRRDQNNKDCDSIQYANFHGTNPPDNSPNGKPHRQARNRQIDNNNFQRILCTGNRGERQNDDHDETMNYSSQISFDQNNTFNQYYPETTRHYNKLRRLDRKSCDVNDNPAYSGYKTQPPRNTGAGKPDDRYVIPARRHRVGTSNNEVGCNKFNRRSLDANNHWVNFTDDHAARPHHRYHRDNIYTTSYRRSSGSVQLHTKNNPRWKTNHN